TNGKRIKRFKRKEYINKLSLVLAEETGLDAERLEDLIHSKAALYSQLPLVIKEDISEKEYYRLKMLENEWPGIYVQKVPRRYYPQGSLGADIIGYMGAINRQEYEKIVQEMADLEDFLQQREVGNYLPLPEGFDDVSQLRKRLKELQKYSYSLNDYVGKTG